MRRSTPNRLTTYALALAGLLASSSCGEGGGTGQPPASLAPYAPLRPFYTALADLQAGRRTRVAILQIGDSHTANDGFSGRMRELMQARFGDGGRGLLPPGIPFKYYRPATVTVTADGWRTTRSGTDSAPSATAPFGLAGLRQDASGPATMAITADPSQLAHLTVDLLAQPGGGSVDLSTDDGHTTTISLSAAGTAPLRAAAPTTPATTSVQLRARGDGPVSVLSWTAEAPGPGITWSNLGTIGAQVSLLANWDPALLAAEARALHPALIVLAFGTNEGFKDSLNLPGYPAQYRAALAALHRAAPDAAILIAGPLGGVRTTGTGTGTACPAEPRYSVPINLPPVRDIERRIAADQHLFFWDWADAMGGDCAIVAWSETDPPMAARDHVHLLKPGYRQTAELLFDTLMRGYDLYRPAQR